METDKIVQRLDEGTILEGPYFGEPVRVLLAKAHGGRVEIVAEGVNTKQTWKKLLKVEDFESAVTIKSSGGMATLTGNARQFRLAAEAHRIRLAYQYDPHFAVSVSQIDPLPHQLDAVYNRLLTPPSIRYLIADDPGAGSTVMVAQPGADKSCFSINHGAGRQIGRKQAIRTLDQQAVDGEFDAEDILTNCR